MQPSQLQLGMGVVKDTEAARAARQQAAAAGLAPPGVEHDVEAVNAALQVAARGNSLSLPFHFSRTTHRRCAPQCR